jgi:hypothetical protein
LHQLSAELFPVWRVAVPVAWRSSYHPDFEGCRLWMFVRNLIQSGVRSLAVQRKLASAIAFRVYLAIEWCLMAEKYLAEFLLPTQPTVELDLLGFQALVESVSPPRISQK